MFAVDYLNMWPPPPGPRLQVGPGGKRRRVSPLPVGLTPLASLDLGPVVPWTLGWTDFLDWISRLDFWTFRLDPWTSGLDFWAFLASQGSLLKLFWGNSTFLDPKVHRFDGLEF